LAEFGVENVFREDVAAAKSLEDTIMASQDRPEAVAENTAVVAKSEAAREAARAAAAKIASAREAAARIAAAREAGAGKAGSRGQG
ncbi:MAG: hypothetical protein HUK26_09700, partial [Duodenibacillus sp.]|nr:hypothetical protein [Duodenibacillus sp.]